jgi:carbamoyltransferase
MSAAILGLNPGFGGFNYHDPAAALLVGRDIIAAAEEERFRREKGAPGVMPKQALRACLTRGGVSLAALDAIAIGYNPSRWGDRLGLEIARAVNVSALRQIMERGQRGTGVGRDDALRAIIQATASLQEILVRAGAWTSDEQAATRIAAELGDPALASRVVFVDHHRAHAEAAFHCSGFAEACVIVLDGVGEFVCASMWDAGGGGLTCIGETGLPNSLGYFYSAATAFLGFTPWQDEGTTMALAPYGAADSVIARRLARIAAVTPDGFDVSAFVLQSLGFGLSLDIDRARAGFARALEMPPRLPDQDITDLYRSVAYHCQAYLEEAVAAYARQAMKRTGQTRLCAAGGVFLNCKLNGFLRERVSPGGFYAFPVSGDAGLAVGAAISVAHARGIDGFSLPSLALGAEDGPEKIDAALARTGLDVLRPADVGDTLALALSEGRIVFWYWERAEFGARALGRRSILADPRDPTLALRINRSIKRRAPWRPFAPSMLHSEAVAVLEGFDPTGPPLTMTHTYRVREAWRTRIPSVVHPADGSTRPHTVLPETDGPYFSIIDRFHARTGIPLILNTSLNGPREPIANCPEHAVALFFASDADILAFGTRLIAKPGRWPAKG